MGWRVACAFTIVATAALVGSAAAAAPGSFSFKLPLPKADKGLIYELTATAKIPAGTTFNSTGNEWLLNVTNQPSLPSYIRAATETFQTGTSKWLIFVAINAPKGLVNAHRLSNAATDTTLDTNVQATPPISGWKPAVGLDSFDQAVICRLLDHMDEEVERAKTEKSFYETLMGASPAEAKTIVGFAKKADPSCK